jgi:hypothetical protein
MDIENRVAEYLKKYSNFANLPEYTELRDGLEPKERIEMNHSDNSVITQLEIPYSLLKEKTNLVRSIASKLWGGNEKIERIFSEMEIDSIEEISYADTKPLKVTVEFSGRLERVFYAKPFDERRLFGLELENLLSPYKYTYSVGDGAIYEDEIHGIEAMEIDGETENDKNYLEEVVGLDYRCYVMLLGDMHDQNYIVSKNKAGEDLRYIVRPIDFDKLFDLNAEIKNNFVLKLSDRKRVIKKLGFDRYIARVNFEIENMRERYIKEEKRFCSLLKNIGSSQTCNSFLYIVSAGLNQGKIFKKLDERKFDFTKAKNMGELLEMHLRNQLNV